MQITFDTNTLTTEDRELIAKAIGFNTEAPATPAPAKEEKAAPAKAAPARTRKAAPAKPEPEPEPEEDEEAEDVAADEPEDDEDEDLLGSKKLTLDDAIARATALVEKGQQAKVKKALVAVGAKRVSELKASQVDAFVEALD